MTFSLDVNSSNWGNLRGGSQGPPWADSTDLALVQPETGAEERRREGRGARSPKAAQPVSPRRLHLSQVPIRRSLSPEQDILASGTNMIKAPRTLSVGHGGSSSARARGLYAAGGAIPRREIPTAPRKFASAQPVALASPRPRLPPALRRRHP